MQEKAQERGPAIVEVTDADFAERVVEESTRRPVVVDFWAAWCAPCRHLSPILEKLAHEEGGEFLLATVDVDANQYTAAQFGIRSIPTVIAFVGGQPVDSFLGAMPEPAVRQWLDRILPSEADREAVDAAEAEREGRPDQAEAAYRVVLAADPGHREARLGLGRVLAGRRAFDEAEEVLKQLSPDPEADRLLAAIRVDRWTSTSLDQTTDPFTAVKRLAAEGRWREALDGMLAVVRDDPEARQAMLDVFGVLGDDDPLTREYRAKLANALF